METSTPQSQTTSPQPAADHVRPIIEVKQLVARYDNRTILDGIDLEVRRGERLLICGGSGCGKTTLLRHLIGLQRPSSGRVIIDGDDITSGDLAVMERVQRKIGMSFQSGALFGSLTLGENVALPLEEYTTLPSSMIERLVRLKLSMVSLAGFEDFMISELSGGMKKRAALARAIALDPKILFFDEPSAGLDPITSAELDELIVQINESLGTTIVVVSHELASIFTIADRVVMLDGGTKKVIAEGPPAELRDHSPNPIVHAFFNRLPRPSEETGRKENGH
jgi:phospholipid/cholesterol/gamma-HCH transport system ATP-binding protein